MELTGSQPQLQRTPSPPEPNDKIVLVGSCDHFCNTRYGSNGSLDCSFGSSGMVTTPVGAGDDWGRDVVVQSDLRLVVVGSTDNGIRDDFLVLRYGANGEPIAHAGPPQTVMTGDLVALDGSGSSDPDGHTPLSFNWQQSGGVIVPLSDAADVSPTFNAPFPGGVLTFTLVVTDSLGLAGSPDAVTVTVETHQLHTPIIIKDP